MPETNGNDDVMPRKRPGPAPKPKVEVEDIQLLLAKIENLEAMVAKLATQTGNMYISAEFGLKAWKASAKDMRKYS